MVLRLEHVCLEDVIQTEWILLEGRWFTFPTKQFKHTGAARPYRPNRTYRPPAAGSKP